MKESQGLRLGKEVIDTDGGHVITIAPSANREKLVVSNLLNYSGSVVVVDTSGAYYSATADARRAMGHQVVKLDPFGITEGDRDSFNPLDIINHTGSSLNDEIRSMIKIIMNENKPPKNPILHRLGQDLLAGVMLYLTAVPEKKLSLDQLRQDFCSDDVVYNLAVILDVLKKQIDPESYESISAFLQRADDQRGSIMSEIHQNLNLYGSANIKSQVEATTFEIGKITSDQPISIYLLFSPLKLSSHTVLIKNWLSSLMYFFSSKPELAATALFILDDAAEYANMAYFNLLPKNRTPRVWSFWNSLAPIKQPEISSKCAYVKNASIYQFFGINNFLLADSIATTFGLNREDILSLPEEEQFIILGAKTIKVLL